MLFSLINTHILVIFCRSSLNYIPSEKLRSQNDISTASSRNANTLRLAQLASLDTRKTDPSKIQRRITLRPIPATFPYTASDYINSFYKYQTIDYSATSSTGRPSFKKTTRETLWSPWPSITNSLLNNGKNEKSSATTPIPSDGSVTATIHKRRENPRNITFITSTALTPASKSTFSTTSKTTVRSSVPSSSSSSSSSETTAHPLQNISSRRRANLEIVKIRASERNSEKAAGTTTIQPYSAEDSTGRTTLEVIYSRRGPTFRKGGQEGYTETTTTIDPNKIVFDDEENNVGGEVDDIVEDVVLKDATTTEVGVTDAQTEPMFFQGNGIRRPDTNSFFTEIGIPTKRSSGSTTSSTTKRSDELVQDNDHEASQTQMPTTLKQMFNFQRSKANRKPISWAALRNRKSEQQQQLQGRSVSVTASTGPAKIALGPRLKFRTKSASTQ